MSRLGKTPIELPKGVDAKSSAQGLIHVKGPQGQLEVHLPQGLTLSIADNQLLIEKQEQVTNAIHGLYRALLQNAVLGVSQGFEKKLTLIGVGYRAAIVGNKLDLQIGLSHPLLMPIPQGLQVTVDKGTAILIRGIDKHLVGQFAAAVRSKKKPEPYKGKGIRYENEIVRKKEGKKATKGK